MIESGVLIINYHRYFLHRIRIENIIPSRSQKPKRNSCKLWRVIAKWVIFPLASVHMSDTKVNATTDGPDYNHDKVLDISGCSWKLLYVLKRYTLVVPIRLSGNFLIWTRNISFCGSHGLQTFFQKKFNNIFGARSINSMGYSFACIYFFWF